MWTIFPLYPNLWQNIHRTSHVKSRKTPRNNVEKRGRFGASTTVSPCRRSHIPVLPEEEETSTEEEHCSVAESSTKRGSCKKAPGNWALDALGTSQIQISPDLVGTRPGKLSHNYGKSPYSMGKSTILITIFNSYVSHYQRVCGLWFLDIYEFHVGVRPGEKILADAKIMAGWIRRGYFRVAQEGGTQRFTQWLSGNFSASHRKHLHKDMFHTTVMPPSACKQIYRAPSSPLDINRLVVSHGKPKNKQNHSVPSLTKS